jgi:hypothetical protein
MNTTNCAKPHNEQYEREREKLIKEWQTLPHQYSFPHFQLIELKKRYGL